MTTIDLVVQSRPEGSWTVIDVAGEIDIFTAPKLREQIMDVVSRGGANILLNLEKVEFMDSTGLGVLVGGLKRVKENDGTLALAGANRTVQRVLSITGLDKVFPMHETVAAAIGG